MGRSCPICGIREPATQSSKADSQSHFLCVCIKLQIETVIDPVWPAECFLLEYEDPNTANATNGTIPVPM